MPNLLLKEFMRALWNGNVAFNADGRLAGLFLFPGTSGSGASWEHMLLTQPAMQEVRMLVMWKRGRKKTRYLDYNVTNAEGIRMSDLARALESYREGDEGVSSVSLDCSQLWMYFYWYEIDDQGMWTGIYRMPTEIYQDLSQQIAQRMAGVPSISRDSDMIR